MLLVAIIHGRHPMTPIRQNGAASLRALVGMVMIGIAAHAGLPYLPLAGPPAMRLEPKKIPTAPVVVATTAIKAPTNLPPVLKTLTMTTNVSEGETNLPVEIVGMPGGTADQTFVTPGFTVTGQGMGSITPQMLATYFRPVTIGTNTGVIGGMLPIGFVPPFTRPETHADSHAEYIVK